MKHHLRVFFAAGVTLFASGVVGQQFPPTVTAINPQAVREGDTVNLKAEIEIMALHEKLDELRDRQLGEMILKQQEQIDMLTRLLTEKGR